jgi:hypothetical protein
MAQSRRTRTRTVAEPTIITFPLVDGQLQPSEPPTPAANRRVDPVAAAKAEAVGAMAAELAEVSVLDAAQGLHRVVQGRSVSLDTVSRLALQGLSYLGASLLGYVFRR